MNNIGQVRIIEKIFPNVYRLKDTTRHYHRKNLKVYHDSTPNPDSSLDEDEKERCDYSNPSRVEGIRSPVGRCTSPADRCFILKVDSQVIITQESWVISTQFEPIKISLDHSKVIYVIDGGFLMHKVKWIKNQSLKDIAWTYIHYISKNCGNTVHIVFDGYEEICTKDAERRRTYSVWMCGIGLKFCARKLTSRVEFVILSRFWFF